MKPALHLQEIFRNEVGAAPSPRPNLLNFRLFVDHVLANDGIVLLDFHLFRRVLFVLVGGIEMPRSG